MRLYLGDDGVIAPMLKNRGKGLIKMREFFLLKVQEQFDKEIYSLNQIDLRLRANYDFNEPNPTYGENHLIWDSWSKIINT